MFIAAVAGIVAFLMHRSSDDAFNVHDSQRGWSDITKKRRAWSWPVRFFAIVWLIAFGVGLCAVARADEAPPPSMYTLELWSSMNGFAVARTVGPMTPAQCTRAIPWLKLVTPDIPPNMRRLIRDCVPKQTMVAQLAGWNCIGSGHKSVPKHPEAAMWTYGCAAP